MEISAKRFLILGWGFDFKFIFHRESTSLRSLALHEETHVGWRLGRITNANLADYRVPVNADIGEIDVSAIDIPDDTCMELLSARFAAFRFH